MIKINKKGVTILIVAFLLLISMHFESLRGFENNTSLISYNEHTIIEKLNRYNLMSQMNKDAVILFTSQKTDNKESEKAFYDASVLSGASKIYKYDITEDEGELKYENGKVKVVKKQSKLYKNVLEKLDDFAEVYALENEYGDLIDSGYKKIYTPYVVFIKDGNIVYSHYLSSEEQISELKDVYLEGYKMITETNI